MTVNVLAISNSILDAAQEQGITVSPMQLQKLLYFLNGWHLEITSGQELLSEKFEAWQFGPVLPYVYHEFKQYGSSPITLKSVNPFTSEPWSVDLENSTKTLLSEVVSTYGKLSGPQMSHLTHKDATPWSNTWKNGQGKGDTISTQDILTEFQSIRQSAAA